MKTQKKAQALQYVSGNIFHKGKVNDVLNVNVSYKISKDKNEYKTINVAIKDKKLIEDLEKIEDKTFVQFLGTPQFRVSADPKNENVKHYNNTLWANKMEVIDFNAVKAGEQHFWYPNNNYIQLKGKLDNNPFFSKIGEKEIDKVSVPFTHIVKYQIDGEWKTKETPITLEAFGKNVEKFKGLNMKKDAYVELDGFVLNGSYEKEGAKAYTCNVVVNDIALQQKKTNDVENEVKPNSLNM